MGRVRANLIYAPALPTTLLHDGGHGGQIIGAAIEVHTALGPGLLESTYEACLVHELLERGMSVEQQKALPVAYKGIRVDCDYRIDLLMEQYLRVLRVLRGKGCSRFAPKTVSAYSCTLAPYASPAKTVAPHGAALQPGVPRRRRPAARRRDDPRGRPARAGPHPQPVRSAGARDRRRG